MAALCSPCTNSSDPTMRGRRCYYCAEKRLTDTLGFRPDHEGTAMSHLVFECQHFVQFRPDHEGTAIFNRLAFLLSFLKSSDPTMRGRR